MKLLKKICFKKINNKGLTLVEVMCAVAILGLVGTAISSALVTSSRSYQRGVSEIDVQQDTQFIKNQIENLIIDSTGDVVFENNELKIQHPDITYTIIFKPEEKSLYYIENNNYNDLHILSDNVHFFEADTSNFTTNRTVSFDLKIAKQGREFASSHLVTSRNGTTSNVPLLPYIATISKLILEPNQEYDIDAIAANLDNQGVNWKVELTQDPSTRINSEGIIKIGNDETANAVFITVSSKEVDEHGDPKAIATIPVSIRRINEFSIYGYLTSGIDKSAGATYTIYPSLLGRNLNKDIGTEYDDDYIDPKQVQWNISSTTPDLYEIVEKTDEKLIIKLKRNMNPGEKIFATGIAKHPNGLNKTGIKYAELEDTWKLISRFIYVVLNDGGLKRNTNDPQGHFTQAFDDMAINELSKKYEYRFKASDETEWSEWFQNTTGNANDNMEINLRPSVTATMLYNKDYNIQIRISIINQNGNTVWPDSSIEEEDYTIDALMKKVSILFKSNMLNFTSANNSLESKEITVQKGNIFDLFEFEKSIGYEDNDIRNSINYIVEKNINGVWKVCPKNEVSVQKGPVCKLKFEQDNFKGDYRVKVIAEDMPIYKFINGVPTKTQDKETFILYNEETNEGIFYFTVK